MIELSFAKPPGGLPSQSRPKIVVGICSSSVDEERRQAVRETWLSDCPSDIECQFFIGGDGGPLPKASDTVVLPVNDSYHGLPDKVLSYFAHALAHSDFDWLFRCDDDTYVALDRLHDLVTGQGEIVGSESLRDRGSPHAGAGYLVSRRLVAALVADATLKRRGREDVIIGEAAVRHGAVPVWTNRLCWNSTPYPRKNNELISAHWCSPERLRAIHTSLSRRPSRTVQATHRGWCDQVEFHDNGVFCRKSSGCNGIWEQNSDGSIALRWFDWDEEALIPEREGEAGVVGPAPSPAKPSAVRESLSRTIAVWVTYAGHGLPHIGKFLTQNPEVTLHVMHGVALDGTARRHAWRNCDRMIRKWWLEQGQHLDFDRAIFLEGDVLFNAKIEEVFPPGDFVGRDVHVPGKSAWRWFSEIDALPVELRPHATGVTPLAALAISRKCLSAMMAEPLAAKLFDADIFCELRLPTLADYCGYEPIPNQQALRNLDWKPVEPGAGDGVWHSVKE